MMRCRAGLLADLHLEGPQRREKHYQAAPLDCNSALDLQPMSVKAHHRKALALEQLSRLGLSKMEEALGSPQLARSHAGAEMQVTCDQLLDRLYSEVLSGKMEDME